MTVFHGGSLVVITREPNPLGSSEPSVYTVLICILLQTLKFARLFGICGRRIGRVVG